MPVTTGPRAFASGEMDDAMPDGGRFAAPDGTRLLLRPLRERDEAAVADLLRHTDADDVRRRFFVSVRAFDHRFLWPLVHYDRRLGVAYVAVEPTTGELSGVARLHCDADKRVGEFAVLVRSGRHRHGLGGALLRHVIAWGRARHVATIRGEVLRENGAMLDLCRDLGFTVHGVRDDPGLMIAELDPSAEPYSTTTLVPSPTRE